MITVSKSNMKSSRLHKYVKNEKVILIMKSRQIVIKK